MSGFGVPGGFDDGSLERQLQRQALQQQQQTNAFNAFAAARAQQHSDYAAQQHLSVMQQQLDHQAVAAQPYYAAASPYARVATYGAAAYAPPQDTTLAQQIYALSSGARQQQPQVTYATAYGTAAAPAYAAPVTSPYARATAAPATALEHQQRYAASYGIAANAAATAATPTAPPPTPYAAHQAREQQQQQQQQQAAYEASQQQHAYAASPPGPSPQAMASARQQQHQQQQQQQQQQHAASAAAHAAHVAAQKHANYTPRSSKSTGSPYTPTSAASSRTTPKASKPKSSTPRTKTPKAPKSSSKPPPKREPAPPKRIQTKDGKIIIGGKAMYYSGCVPLGLEDDKYWLSELQVYLRKNFAEAFGATEDDIAAPMHGRNKPIALGQVGIRCKHCKHDNPAERGQQATSYPSLISGIYNSVQQMLRLHLDCCLSMPTEVKDKIEALKLSCSSRGGRKQYWIDSGRRLGLVDTAHGIHFGRDPYGPLPPLTGPSINFKEGRRRRMLKASAELEARKAAQGETKEEVPTVDDRPLVFENDQCLISDYLYLTLEQMAPCTLMEADRVGCYKTRKVGFPGLACKHCVGQAGCGRYFPASEASLSQTTTSQTIMNHVRNCRRCPTEIRENLEIMKRNRMGPDGKRADKPKHGGRKVFFHRLWCRIQGLEIQESKGQTKEARKKKAKKVGVKKQRKAAAAESDSDDVITSDEETESEEESEMSDGESSQLLKKKRRGVTPVKKKPQDAPCFEGCVRLTKTDDPSWLSEMECFARSDLVEVFSFKQESELGGYVGRKEPAVGQVGVRCVFCKSLESSERPTGCVSYPESLSTIHLKVTDMIRLHFPGCPSISNDAKETFKSYRGFDAKVANDDAQQYWIDAARDIGLSNIPPGGSRKDGAWGITFRRDPLQPSPADELDLENSESNGSPANFGKNSLVRPDDHGLCTDQVMLLLRQVQPCRFKKSDRRAGPGHRGRDRAMGFPGLSCMHCAGQNTLGRYFSVSAKNMTDCTSNSLQTHVASCAYCPEPIRASLAYLGHRSILQKAELRGCWKKAFFKKIWDRLHVERKWTSIDDDDGAEDNGVAMAIDYQEEEQDAENGEEGDSDSEKEELGGQMNALIKAAAIWLTEQDVATDQARKATKTARALPAKRNSNGVGSHSSGRRSDSSLPSKRRRVRF